jgi:hypothetical protein
MSKQNLSLLTILIAVLFLSGCLGRQLTINTTPQDALVELNDEQIGQSPVTVSFNWYGDYKVRITKPGFETLKTHRLLKAPWYDAFPFDLFAQVLTSERKVDSYEWTFDLQKQKQISRDQLIKNAQTLEEQLK